MRQRLGVKTGEAKTRTHRQRDKRQGDIDRGDKGREEKGKRAMLEQRQNGEVGDNLGHLGQRERRLKRLCADRPAGCRLGLYAGVGQGSVRGRSGVGQG